MADNRVHMTIWCTAPQEAFGPRHAMPDEIAAKIEEQGEIPCNGTGQPAAYCVGCRWAMIETDKDNAS